MPAERALLKHVQNSSLKSGIQNILVPIYNFDDFDNISYEPKKIGHIFWWCIEPFKNQIRIFNWDLTYKVNFISFEYQASNSNAEWTVGFTSFSWFIQFHHCPALHFTLLKGFSYVVLLSFCCQADWIWGIFYYACQKVFFIGIFLEWPSSTI